MKPAHHFARRCLRMLALVCLLPLVARAANPNIQGVPAQLGTSDDTAMYIYLGATVQEGDTNLLAVTFDYAPTNVGTINPLPAGVMQNGTNYTITATNENQATAILTNVLFTPRENFIVVPGISNVVFHIKVTDAGNGSSSTKTTTLHISSVNDAPTVTVGSGSTTPSITDTNTTLVFTNILISDVDDSSNQTVAVSVTLSPTNSGFFSTNSLAATGFTSNATSYSFSGTPAQAQAAVRALVFTPVKDFAPVGSNTLTSLRVVVSDGNSTPVTNNSYTVTALSINDVPQLTGLPGAHISVPTGQTASPFLQATLIDLDQNLVLTNDNGENLTWTVTLSGNSPRGSLQSGGINVGSSASGGGDPSVSTTGLRNIVYVAPTLAIAGTNTLTLAVTASDGHGGTLSNNVYIDLYSLTSPPGLTGTQTGQTMNDNTTLAAFSKVNIQSFNGSSVTVKISLNGQTNDVQGALINLGSFAKTTPVGATSVYSFTGTSEAATAAIRSLLFQPTPNRINGSITEQTTLAITLIDGTVTNAPDLTTTVIVTPVNDNPALAGISPLLPILDTETAAPFSTVSITDVDESGNQTNTCTLTLDLDAKGWFTTNSLALSGFVSNNAAYTFTGRPSQITTAIRKLVFMPRPGRVPVGLTETTIFTINLNDSHGGIVANAGTAVRVASVSGLPVINVPTPQPVSIPLSTNIQPFQQVTVTDPTALACLISIVNPAQGSFSTNTLALTGVTNRGGGFYYVSGNASNVTWALQNLGFTPAGTLTLGAQVNFTISVTNSLPNFVTASHSIVLRTVQNSYIVTKLTDYDPAGSVPSLQKEGTLRKAIADAKNNDHITFDIRSGIPGTPDYPAVIRLVAPIDLNNNLTFDGPGADRLTISGDSDGDGTADVALFNVNAGVTVNRLAFTKGHSSSAGGAFEVNQTGDLRLSYCSISDSIADVWGGAIDVDGGSLTMDHCLLKGNSTSATLGQGGGAISLYTFFPCFISHTTFATNRQNAIGGLGGGALYAETEDAGVGFSTTLLNCTFHDNVDAAGHGSSIRPNVFNTFVKLQNTIVADGSGRNIEMDLSGMVVSQAGNISDDATSTTFSIGGSATNNTVFRIPGDQMNVNLTNLMSALLANNGGPTPTYALTGNAAISFAVSNFPGATFYSQLGTDQRGYFRDHNPDAGAFEQGASQRIIIEELNFNPAYSNNEFIEFYVPRDSTAVDLGGFQVLVSGTNRHIFTTQVLQPGEALVLFSAGATNTGVPTGVYSQIAAGNLQMDDASGIITLLNPSNQIVFTADYVGAFTSTDPNDYGHLNTPNQSLVLSPQFQGVFLPYQRVAAKEGGDTNLLSNAGYDVVGAPLAIGNAPPRAFDDVAATDAHTPLTNINVLVNDTDLDVTDALRVSGVGTNANPGVTGLTNYSLLGALVTINNSPTTGASIKYDPTASALLMSLPEGSNVVDSFQYTILDSSNGVDHVRGSTGAEITNNLIKATATVTVSVVGVNSAPTPQSDNVASNAVLTTAEDVVLDFTTANNILVNDTDINTDDNSTTLSIVGVNNAASYVTNQFTTTTALGADVVLDVRFDRNETHITYNPTNSAILNALGLGQSTNDTFWYTVKDSHGATGTAAVTITVTGVNDGPTANPNAFATDEATTVSVTTASLLANDTDPDIGTTLTVSALSSSSALGASVQLVGTNVIYNPTGSSTLNALAQKETATDTFTYTATDEHGLSSTTTVTVTVAGVNDRPVAVADTYTGNEDALLITNAPGVMANDIEYDINGLTPDDSLRVLPFTNVSSIGVGVTLTANGTFSYDPRGILDYLKAGQVTNEVFSYVVMDHSLSVANDDQFAATAGTSNNVLPVLANDVVLSAAGGSFSLASVGTPDHGGTVSINAGSNAVIYTPAAGFSGTETFGYTAGDGLGGFDTATVTVTLSSNSLFAIADTFTVARGTTNTFNLVANDSLIPSSGAGITITAVGPTAFGGTVTLNGAGPSNRVDYVPNPAQPTPFVDTFSYTITSGVLTATNTVTVTVLDRANTLTLNNDSFTVIAGSGNNSLDVLANDLILPTPNTNLVITAFTSNSVLGTVSLNAARTRLIYKPSSSVTNFPEPVITYTVSDGAGGSATASVNVRVVPSGFIAGDDTFVVVKNSTNNLSVMINDALLPSQGQTLFVSGIGIGTNAPNQGGTAAINGPGTGITYKPAIDFVGAEDFAYEISDGSPARALGRVHVVVLDNSAANSNPDTYRFARASSNNVMAVLANDYPLPKTSGAYTITGLQTNTVHAVVTRNGTGANNTLLYSPFPGFIGRDTFKYEFTDTFGNLGTNTVQVTIGDLFPLADTFAVLSGSSGNLLDVRANDYVYPDSTGLRTVAALGTPDHGGAVSASPGNAGILYTPPGGFTGTEHFTYQLADDSANLFTATATVVVKPAGSDRDTNTISLTINGLNDTPIVTGNTNRAITDKQTTLPFSGISITDLDEFGAQQLTVKVTMDNLDKGALSVLGGFSQTASGEFTMHGTPAAITAALRTMVFTPVPNHIIVPTTNTVHFVLTVDDGYVLNPITTLVNVAITAVNDAPVIAGTVAGQTVYNKTSIRPFTTVLITEVDNDTLQPLRVTVMLNNATNGNLSNLGGFADLGGGVYSIGASNGAITAAIATTALRGLVFTPTTANRVTPGVPETTRFTIRVDDFFAPTVVDSNTTVVATHPQTTRIIPGDKTNGMQFGWAVATTRDFAVVSAPHDPANTNSGSIYLYNRSLDGSNTWTLLKKIVPPDGKSLDEFGFSLSVSGDVLVVGARLTDDKGANSGSAYVYHRDQGGSNNWGFVKKLTASDGAANDNLGYSVSVSSNTIVLGSYLADAGAADAGAAYVYSRNQGGTNNWGQVKKLTAGDLALTDHFGTAVAVSGDDLFVGSALADVATNADAGAVYVFSRNQGGTENWGQVKKLTATDAVNTDHFGETLSVNGDLLAVGAPLANQGATNDVGAVYLCSRNQGGTTNWGAFKKMFAGDSLAGDHFGSSISFNGDSLVIGAQLADAAAADAGSAYLYWQNTGGSNNWGQVDKFLPSTLNASDNFGCGVAVSRGTVVIGAYNALDVSPARPGTAYMFRTKYNNAPRVVTPLVDQFVMPNNPLNYTIPAGTFDDGDFNESLTIGLTGTVPGWVNYNTTNRQFTGTPTVVGVYPISVVATDSDGASVTNSFNINVASTVVATSSLMMGAQPLGTNLVPVITLTGVANTAYRLQSTTSVNGTIIWTDTSSGTTDGSGTLIFYDVIVSPNRFYRAVSP